MKKMRRRLLLILVLSFFLLGNAPAPYWACQGKSQGDACTWGYGCSRTMQICRLRSQCQDDPATSVNECLWCQ